MSLFSTLWSPTRGTKNKGYWLAIYFSCILFIEPGSPALTGGFFNTSATVCMYVYVLWRASLMAQMVKKLSAMQETEETWVWSLGWEDPLEKGMATHSRILVWRIPWTEEPGGLQSIGLQRVRHHWSHLAHTQAYIYNSDFPPESYRQISIYYFGKRTYSKRPTSKSDWTHSQRI